VKRPSIVLGVACLAACADPGRPLPVSAEGDARRGEAAIARYECGACHRIPGIPGARGRVGPSLEAFRQRMYIAGRIPNVTERLVRWLQDPPSLAPTTAMPDVGVTASDARDIAAYLYTLE
jgi:cytochrome c